MSYLAPKNIAERPVVIIGAGTLGRRIAAVFTSGGAQVRVVDTKEEQRRQAVDYVNETADELRTKTPHPDAVTIRELETYAEADSESLTDAWLVIEAVPERLDIKRPLFGTLDELAPADAILATNSSSYASREVIDEVEHTERVLNMHFAMPPTSMAVELMSDGATDETIIELLVEELPRFGIMPFVAHKESTGFIFNRIWAAIKRESLAVVADGVSTPEDVDAILKVNTGGALEPFRLMDQVGLDVVLDIEEHYAEENPNLPTGPRELLHSYVDAGRLGRKSGQGFYDYSESSGS
ncbi:3-hydroxyacyl-CoA dehydrogenase family protein [Brevibacterium renqingii]|uniref:3-hydroxyacyl-CoA dehydrogenase family protein n=1 Tax=Brevibacterium renqingii TaxID=2776916 RepID=UPI001ADFFEB3|nr:3-hydroxyacyl-CoA dehydrogenase family protein [Brevibacterium renqingii]